MENASKALLIAGAVLIVIVLISVGVLIVNQASGVTDQASDITTSQAVETFNNQFQNYAGIQKGSSVKTLLSAIATSNATNNNTSGHMIKVTFTNNTAAGATPAASTVTDKDTITKLVSGVVNSARYQVDLDSRDDDGYINAITITRKATT